MARLLLLLLFFQMIGKLSAQENFGYFGKLSHFEISSSSYIPVNDIRKSGEYYIASDDNKTLEEKNVFLHVGLRTSIGRNFRARFGMALEFGFDKFQLKNQFLTSPIPFESGEINFIKHESISVRSFLIMPKFEFCGKQTLLPNGFIHQIGIGGTINYVIDDERVAIGLYDDGGPAPWDSEQFTLQDHEDLDISFGGFQLMYSIRFRSPIGKFFLLTYGLRFTADFTLEQKYIPGTFGKEVRQQTLRYLALNVASLDLGLTLPF